MAGVLTFSILHLPKRLARSNQRSSAFNNLAATFKNAEQLS
jgi:hypothetical protein